MTLSVAGRLAQGPGVISPLARLALAFVDGGTEWLRWAIAEPAVNYQFPDETSLVAQVQQGLHASRMALLPQLQLLVSPVKLMTLGEVDLRTLARAESGDASSVTAAQVRNILSTHHILSATELAAARAFLGQLGVASAPLFQALDFADCLALYELMCMPTPGGADASALQAEAAAFAVQQARTPLEFCDYCQVYVQRAERAGLLSASPQQRQAAAAAAVQTLAPLMFGALDCPQLEGLPSPAEVGRAVSNWLTRGRAMGFARVSQGVQQLVQNSSYQGQAADAARAILNQYLQAAQAFLVNQRPSQGLMGQDGVTCLFPMESNGQQAQLLLGANGVISLRSFGKTPAASATAPAAGAATPAATTAATTPAGLSTTPAALSASAAKAAPASLPSAPAPAAAPASPTTTASGTEATPS